MWLYGKIIAVDFHTSILCNRSTEKDQCKKNVKWEINPQIDEILLPKDGRWCWIWNKLSTGVLDWYNWFKDYTKLWCQSDIWVYYFSMIVKKWQYKKNWYIHNSQNYSGLRQLLQKFSSLCKAETVYEGGLKVILLLQISSLDFETTFIIFCLNWKMLQDLLK